MTPPPLPDSVLLLCVDLQPTFLRAMADRETLERRCHFTIAAAAGLGLRTVFTEQVPSKLGGTLPSLLEAARAPATIFAKNAFSALRDPGVENFLQREPAAHVLLCGLETPVCIYQTAADCLERGLGVTLLTDALGARRPRDAADCLAELTRAGAHALPSETVLYALLGGAEHPFFRDFTQLVKSHG